jgi:hypothetical protein
LLVARVVLFDRERTAEPGRSESFMGEPGAEPGAEDSSPVDALDERSVEVAGRSEAERVYEVRRNKAEELELEAASPVRNERRSCRGAGGRVGLCIEGIGATRCSGVLCSGAALCDQRNARHGARRPRAAGHVETCHDEQTEDGSHLGGAGADGLLGAKRGGGARRRLVLVAVVARLRLPAASAEGVRRRGGRVGS